MSESYERDLWDQLNALLKLAETGPGSVQARIDISVTGTPFRSASIQIPPYILRQFLKGRPRP